jgi:uncharacterized protein
LNGACSLRRSGGERAVDSSMASDLNEALCVAAERGDVPEIERLVAAGADPNAFEGRARWTALQRAARFDHVAAVPALLAAGAHVNGTDSYGLTPLMAAAWRGQSMTIAALLAAGADLQCANHQGTTALHWASAWGHLSAARALVGAGARLDVCNRSDERPIDVVRGARVGAARERHRQAPRHPSPSLAPPEQVCSVAGDLESVRPALHALLARAEPWLRRRPVAAACYGALWEDDA